MVVDNMKISIKNYKNLTNLEYEIEDKKINFLFGISGAGKSSIPNAIVDLDPNDNKSFGTGESVIIHIDGNEPNKENFMIFNDETLKMYFDTNENENVYPVLIDDENEYKKAQNILFSQIEEIEIIINQLKERYSNISNLVKNMGASTLGKGDTLKKTSQLQKIISSIESVENTRIYKEIIALPEGKFDWTLQGIEYIFNDECPMCNKKLSKKNLQKFIKFKKFDNKSIKVIKEDKEKYQNITNIVLNNNLTELRVMCKKIINMSLACKSYVNIMSKIFELKKLNDFSSKIKPLEFEKELFLYFPELRIVVNRFNNHIEDLKKKYDKAKEKTAKILNKKASNINKIIRTFGIPYQIQAKYNQGKITEYKLVHNNDLTKNDSKAKLSSGEKNIIALILFIFAAQKNPNSILIIDDPVSSYDEYRRKQICDLIVNRLNDQTVLLLSHDCVFAKYAVLEHEKKNNIGKVDYLQNYFGTVNVVNITKKDFGVFTDFLIERVNNINCYYQKILNLRMLYEGKYKNPVYGYLSGLLHALQVNDIKSKLSDLNYTEEEILLKIEEDLGVKLEPCFDDYYKNINTDEFSFFEKALFYREYMKHHLNVEKTFKPELDNYIHLNSRLYISLNPYNYIFSSPNLYINVSELINGSMNVKEV